MSVSACSVWVRKDVVLNIRRIPHQDYILDILQLTLLFCNDIAQGISKSMVLIHYLKCHCCQIFSVSR